MWRYVLRRLVGIVPIILLVVLIVFYILNITPGDPALIILGKDAPQQAIDDLNEELGLNDPFFVRYANYIKGILKLDFGLSYRSRKPVFDEILPRFPTTLTLALLTVIVTTLIGVPLGIISAVKQYSALDISLTVTFLVVASVPGFWLGLMLILIFSLKLGWLPSNGVGSIKHFILPVLAAALPSAAFQARVTRNQMLETMRQDYIRTARAKGAPTKRIILRHALKNAMMPVITMVGMGFAYSLGGSMITEIVFGLPGIGNFIVTAIRNKDMPVVMGSTVFLATLFMVIMLLVDLAYAFINPIIRAQFEKE
jgi:peptide/nickel transport system permease protein